MEYNNTEIEKIKIIADELEKFRKDIISIDYIHNKIDFFEIMERFRKYLVERSIGNNFEIFYHSKYYKFYKDFFTDINEYYIRSLESMQAISVMTQGIHNFESVSEFLNSDFLKEGFERKSKEFAVIDSSKVKNIVFVGCGPFPETMLYVYENFNVDKILGLDYNHEAIYMAGEMMNGLGYTNISFKQIDAVDFDYSDAD
ncbi:MAG: hypothetical protein Q9M94_01005, partial [Candidatus Gracilibacteria bacterium]|nr:hypothetical protein [Candidatus Gracilibacteria bacterium]